MFNAKRGARFSAWLISSRTCRFRHVTGALGLVALLVNGENGMDMVGKYWRQRPPAVRCVAAVLFVAFVLFLTGCGTTQHQQKSAQRFPIKGKVTLVIPQMQRVVIQHSGITGWASASNMEFPVKDSAELENLVPGLEIQAVLRVEAERFWIEDIKVVKKENNDR